MNKKEFDSIKNEAAKFIPLLRSLEIQEKPHASGTGTDNVALQFVGRRSQGTWVVLEHTKVLTPNEFGSVAALEHHLLAFRARYHTIATPFRWTFTRDDLHQLFARLAAADAHRPAA
jgi:hypothetical protein